MQRILIVTPDPNRLAGFSRALAGGQTLQLAWAHDGTAAVADVIKHPPSPCSSTTLCRTCRRSTWCAACCRSTP